MRMRLLFGTYLIVIVAGLGYFIAIAALHI